MNEELKTYLTEFELNEPTTLTVIREVEELLGISLPNDYSNFLLFTNGGEGIVGQSYLALWKIEDLHELNDAYKTYEFAPGLVIIGSNGSDIAYCLDTRTNAKPFVAVPFIGMGLDEVQHCGNNLLDLLEFLYRA